MFQKLLCRSKSTEDVTGEAPYCVREEELYGIEEIPADMIQERSTLAGTGILFSEGVPEDIRRTYTALHRVYSIGSTILGNKRKSCTIKTELFPTI